MKKERFQRPRAFWGVAFFCLFAAAASAQEAARLTSVHHVIHSRELEVFIRVEGSFEYRFYELQGPKRLMIDLTPIEDIRSPAEIQVGAFGVIKIRTGRPEPGTARVAFDLEEMFSFYLVNKISDGIHVVFLSGSSGKRAETGMARPAAPSESPAAEEPPTRRRSTLLGLSLVNAFLADDRFQTVFARQTESALALELAQDIVSRGSFTAGAAVEYRRFSLEGQSTLTGRRTRVSIAPLDLSLRVMIKTGHFRPYVSGGAVFSRYDEESTLQDTTGSAIGPSLQGGLYWGPPSLPGLKAKAYVKWTRAVAEENGIEVNLGGIEVGACLSLWFSFF